MRYRKVIAVRDGEARIVTTKRYFEYERRRAADPAAVKAEGESSPACEEACAENGGVEECAASWVRCTDGTTWLIDP